MSLPLTPANVVAEAVAKIPDEPTPESEAKESFSSDEAKRRALANRSDEQDIEQRKKYADSAYKITTIWTSFLIGISILQLLSRLWDKGLKEAEFIAVLTTTTASVFGFWYLVGRYLFKGSDKSDK